jgi:hypothetical protein
MQEIMDATYGAEDEHPLDECRFIRCTFLPRGSTNKFSNCEFIDCGFNTIGASAEDKAERRKAAGLFSGMVQKRLSAFTAQTFEFFMCEFRNSKFADLILDRTLFNICFFHGLDFDNVEFRNVRFVQGWGIHTCTGLEYVRVSPSEGRVILDADVERLRLPFTERFLSWERLRTVGRLPLFSVSVGALVLVPIVFLGIALFNEQVGRWKTAIELSKIPAERLGGWPEVIGKCCLMA